MTDRFDTLINNFEERVTTREISTSCGTLTDYEQNNAEYARDDLRTEIDGLITQIDTLKTNLADILLIVEKHGDRVILAHATRLGKAYLAIGGEEPWRLP